MGRGPVVDVDPAVRVAIAASHLRDVSAVTIERLLQGSRRIAVPAGSTVRGAGEVGPHLELLVDGFVRIFIVAPDGRTLTIRYFRQGALTGVASLFTPQFAMPGSIQALRDSDILVFDPDVVRRLTVLDLGIAQGLLAELSERVVSFVSEIPGSAFTSVRQRVARHLLDLASERQQGRALVAHVSQQALADAVGSVREVVVRVLRDLREEGLIRTGRSGITILDPAHLMSESIHEPPNTGGTDRNAGS
jgi:CRP/FNR family transcriptional regulator, cyclic AMP receptor protein